MRKRITFLGCPVDRLTVGETLEWMATAAEDRRPRHAVVVNANKLHMMRGNPELAAIVKRADLVVPEWAVVWGAKRLGLPAVPHSGGLLIARDYMPFAAARGLRPFLLGAAPSVVSALVDRLRRDYPALQIAGFHHGYLTTPAIERQVVEQIRASCADALFVAMGSPAQEFWIDRHKAELSVPVSIGIGGTFDVLSGLKADTPAWARGHGLEWLYRMAHDPRKYAGRYFVTNTSFLLALLKARFARPGGAGLPAGKN